MLINTATDLENAESSIERTAFLTNLLNDYITFDDALYPEGYDRTLVEGDAGYVTPVVRLEWNAGASAAWGFTSREQIEEALALESFTGSIALLDIPDTVELGSRK